MSQPPCTASAKHGGPCRAFALPGSLTCRVHAPEYAEAVQAARVRGGRAAGQLRSIAGRRPKLDDAAGLVRFNAGLVNRLLAGELEVDTVRCLVYALNLQRQLIESSDLEKRLNRLEEQLTASGTQQRTGGRQW